MQFAVQLRQQRRGKTFGVSTQALHVLRCFTLFAVLPVSRVAAMLPYFLEVGILFWVTFGSPMVLPATDPARRLAISEKGLEFCGWRVGAQTIWANTAG